MKHSEISKLKINLFHEALCVRQHGVPKGMVKIMNFRSESIDRLFETFLHLETVDECYAYFEDLCTIKEIQDMAQRLDTAILLSKGMSYQKITEEVKVSTATIGRVSKCLNYGGGGYRNAIEKLKNEEKK